MDIPVRATERVRVGGLDDTLGFLLRLAQLRSFEEFFTHLGMRGFRPGEFSVLYVIRQNPGIRQSALCQRMMIKRAHMTKLIRSFEDRGLVSRRIPDEDRRAVELSLTPEGERLMDENTEAFFAHEQTTGSPLTRQERQQLVVLLRKYVGVEEEKTDEYR